MGSTGRTNFGQMGRGADVPFFGDTDISEERAYARSKPMIREQFDVSPVSASVTYGTEMTFELDKRADRLGKIELVLDRSAGVGGGAWNDWEVYSTIDYASFQYGNKELHRITGEELYHEMERNDTVEERAAAAAMQHGDLTLVQRVATGAAAATLIADLRLPWKHLKRMIAMVALPNKVRVVIKFKPLNEAANTITSVATLSVLLRCQYWHMRQADRDALFKKANSSKSGIVTKFARNEFHRREAIPMSSTSVTLKLRNTKNAVFELFFVTRLQSQFTSPNVDLWTYVEPLTFWLEDNGSRVTEIITFKDAAIGTPSYGKYVQNQEAHPNAAMLGIKIPSIAFCPNELVEASETDCFCSRNFSKYNNLELRITYSAADLPSAAYLDVYGRIHDVMITKQGDLRRFLQ